MTFQQALDMGYTIGDVRFQKGYVSRKCNVGNQPVLIAKGNRKGEKYVLIPNFKSTRYCFRYYLIEPK